MRMKKRVCRILTYVLALQFCIGGMSQHALAYSTSAQLQEAVNNAAQGAIIEITEDVFFSSAVEIPADAEVTIRSDQSGPYTLWAFDNTARHFHVRGKLILEDIILDGRADENGGTPIGGGIVVSGGTLEINEGVAIQNCISQGYGGGVEVRAGQLAMNGGAIQRNTTSANSSGGGGVLLVNSSFVMHDGKISENELPGSYMNYGGGVLVDSNSSFIMHGGEISGNKSSLVGGGVAVCETAPGTGNHSFIMKGGTIQDNTAQYGGGVFIWAGGAKFGMEGGTITGNRADQYGGGVHADANSCFEIEGDAEISGNMAKYGGGVSVTNTQASPLSPSMVMNGGNIIHNGNLINGDSGIPFISEGGGIYLGAGSELMINSGKIDSNIAYYDGGGIHAAPDASIEMNGGEISRNVAEAYNGGGISGEGCEIKMNDGKISLNRAGFSFGTGGGICITERAALTMTGGEITGNEAGAGGAVYANSYTSLTIGDADNPQAAPVVSENSADYSGGGFSLGWECTLNIFSRAKIAANRAQNSAGGISSSGVVNIYGSAEVSDNSANIGGGIVSYVLNLYGNAQVKNNTATEFGGGIAAYAQDGVSNPIEISIWDNAKVIDNEAGTDGGGIYAVNRRDPAEILFIDAAGNAEIRGNTAGANGGGIYVEKLDVVTAGEDVVFADNAAATGYAWNVNDPKNDAQTAAAGIHNSNILTNTFTLPFTNAYSNYDIYYAADDAYYVWYKANSGVGDYLDTGLSLASNYPVLALADTGISRSNYDFTGWNTEADGSGTAYAPGDIIVIDGNVILHAQWKDREDKDKDKDKETPGGGTVDPKPQEPPSGDLDLENHFAYIIGYVDNTVRPDNNITRSEVAAIFFRLLTQESRAELWSKQNSFWDVAGTDWYNNPVSTLANGNILKGCPDGSFRPNGNITRAELATIAARFGPKENIATEGSSIAFSDISNHWAEDYITLAAALGYVQGYGDNTFRPDAPITRAEVATLLNNVLNRHVESMEDLHADMITWPDNRPDAWYYFAMQEATNSHFYDRKADGIHESWTGIRPRPDWSALEKPQAVPGDVSY